MSSCFFKQGRVMLRNSYVLTGFFKLAPCCWLIFSQVKAVSGLRAGVVRSRREKMRGAQARRSALPSTRRQRSVFYSTDCLTCCACIWSASCEGSNWLLFLCFFLFVSPSLAWWRHALPSLDIFYCISHSEKILQLCNPPLCASHIFHPLVAGYFSRTPVSFQQTFKLTFK